MGHLSGKRTSGNDFLLGINLAANEAAASGANDLLVDEYGHTVTTHMYADGHAYGSCRWDAHKHIFYTGSTQADEHRHRTQLSFTVLGAEQGRAARLLNTSDSKGAAPNKAGFLKGY